jgi:hypothetical protein
VLPDVASGKCAVRIASNSRGNGSPNNERSSQFSFPGARRNQFGDGVGRICEKSCTSACLPCDACQRMRRDKGLKCSRWVVVPH